MWYVFGDLSGEKNGKQFGMMSSTALRSVDYKKELRQEKLTLQAKFKGQYRHIEYGLVNQKSFRIETFKPLQSCDVTHD